MKRSFGLILLILLAGCQLPPPVREPTREIWSWFMPHYDQPGTAAVSRNIVPGQSTRHDVYNRFGPPASASRAEQQPAGIRFAGDPQLPPGTHQVWTYHLSEIRHSAAIDPRSIAFHGVTATFMFDPDGTLLDYRLSETIR